MLELPFGVKRHGVYGGVEKVSAKTLVPHVGLAIALAALQYAEPGRVAILTGTNHHFGDPLQQLLDEVNFSNTQARRQPKRAIARSDARYFLTGWTNLETGATVKDAEEALQTAEGRRQWRPTKNWKKLFDLLLAT